MFDVVFLVVFEVVFVVVVFFVVLLVVFVDEFWVVLDVEFEVELLEEEFVITIPDAEAEKILSAEDAINFISTHPNAK